MNTVGPMHEISKREEVISPWVTLVARTVASAPGQEGRVFHSLKQSDYVAVLAVTQSGEYPLVRQYRPACSSVTLELPSGLMEAGESPEQCARRELAEEVGFDVDESSLQRLGVLRPDTGCLENRLWCFFASGVRPIAHWHPEPAIAREMFGRENLMQAIAEGHFDHALHVAVAGLAIMRGLI